METSKRQRDEIMEGEDEVLISITQNEVIQTSIL